MPAKKQILTSRHKGLTLEWAKGYLNRPSDTILFTDETRMPLNGPDNWIKGWVLNNEKRPIITRRQKQGGGIMIWAGIMDDTILGPIRIPDGVKLTAKTYTKFLRENLLPFLMKLNPIQKKNFLFMQDNAPSHSARLTKDFLKISGINLMQWPPNSPDLDPIENLCSIIKSKLYQNSKKYQNKNALWDEIQKITKNLYAKIIS